MEPSRTREGIARHIRNLGHPDTARARRAEGFLIRYYGSRALEALFGDIGIFVHLNSGRREHLPGRQPWVAGRTIG